MCVFVCLGNLESEWIRDLVSRDAEEYYAQEDMRIEEELGRWPHGPSSEQADIERVDSVFVTQCPVNWWSTTELSGRAREPHENSGEAAWHERCID